MDLLFFQDALVKFVQSHDIVQRECKLYIRNQKTERWVPSPVVIIIVGGGLQMGSCSFYTLPHDSGNHYGFMLVIHLSAIQ